MAPDPIFAFSTNFCNANPVEPGFEGIVRLAHSYQLGNVEILRI
jgi:hypothetical protein